MMRREPITNTTNAVSVRNETVTNQTQTTTIRDLSSMTDRRVTDGNKIVGNYEVTLGTTLTPRQ